MSPYNSKNFMFLKATSLEHLYPILEDNEMICYRVPTNEKVYMDARRIVEELVQRIMAKKGIIEEEKLSSNLNNLRRKLPQEIYDKFNQIRLMGNCYAHFNKDVVLIPPVEILKMLHECLSWYVNTWEVGHNVVSKFEAPLEILQNQDNVRILRIKEEFEVESNLLKKEYEETQASLRGTEVRLQAVRKQNEAMEQKIKLQNEKLRNTNKDYKKSQQEVEQLKWNLACNDEKVKKLQNQLKALEANLAAKDEINSESLSVREIKALNQQLLVETKECKAAVDATEERLKTMSDIFQHSRIAGVNYEAFYRGFLNLEGEQLRMVYAMLTRLNLLNLTKAVIGNQMNKLRSIQADEVDKLLKREVIQLRGIQDEEIKLRLYYGLLKICHIEQGTLDNQVNFKHHLDAIVEYGFATLCKEKEFVQSENKLQSIITYYMRKIFEDFEEKFQSADQTTQEALVTQIYNGFENLPEEQRQKLYDKIGVKDTSEQSIKSAIMTLGPTVILSTVVGLGGFASYMTLSSLIHGISTLLGTTFSFGVYTGAASFLSFLTGPFMIVLLIGQGILLYKSMDKQQQSLVPLIIMQIVTNEACFKESQDDDGNYQKLVQHWEGKKQVYVDLGEEQNAAKDRVSQLNAQKTQQLEKQGEIQQRKSQVNLEKEAEIERLRPLIKNHIHLKQLKGYEKYTIICNDITNNQVKKQMAPQGFFKTILHKSTTGLMGLNLNHKLQMCEKELVEEARSQPFFEEDTKQLNSYYQQLGEIENTLHILTDEMSQVKEAIRNQEEVINRIGSEMKAISKIYLDLENIQI